MAISLNKGLTRFLPANGFARNVATLSGATALGQLITLLALPVLTRLYVPGEFGAAAVYGGIVGLIVVVASLRYEIAIPLPITDRGALHVAMVSFGILAIVTIAAGLISPPLVNHLGEHAGLPIWAFAGLVSFGVLTAGVYQVTNYWAVRKSKFGTIARTRIQQGLAGTGFQLALGFAGFGVLGLIVGQIIGQCAGIARLAVGMIADNRRSGSRIHRRGLAWAAGRYRRFPLYDSWAGLLNVAGAQAPVLLFAALFSPTLAGYYALALRILSAPLGLVGKSVSQALLPRVIEARRQGAAQDLMSKLLHTLAVFSLLPFAIVALISADFVPLVFGAEWAPATTVIAWTAIWTGWQFICSPLSVILLGIEAQKLNAGLQFALSALRILAIVGGALLGSADVALIAFSVASLIGYAGYTLATGLAVGLTTRAMVAVVWQPALLAFMAIIVTVMMPPDYSEANYAVAALLAALWAWSCWKIVRAHWAAVGASPLTPA